MANFKEIEKANATIKTTNIKGKDYAEVNQRIKAFRQLYPEGYIKTKIVELDMAAGIILMTAQVGYYDENGNDRILGEGSSFEWKNDPKSMVNKTSYVENCETSAVGRALGMLGLGVDVALASADEVKTAIQHQQNGEEAPQPNITCQRCGVVIGTHGKATAKQVAAATKKQFGKVMCWECGHITKQEQDEAKKKAESGDVAQLAEDAALQLPFPIDD